MADSSISQAPESWTGIAPAAETAADTLRQRARTRRSSYVAEGLSFLIDAGILLLYAVAGTTPYWTPALYLLAGLAVTFTLIALSETNFNDRFRDHYLTVPHCVSTMTVALAAAYFAPEVGIYLVCVNFIILGFGSLRMTARQAGLVWTYLTAGLAILFLMTDKPIAMPMASWTERVLALVCFVTVLGRCAFTGLYGSSLREALYKRRNELAEANARIEEMSQIDELTGTLNRRSILRSLDEEIARARRNGRAACVALIDLDLFKRINDTFGHLTGDEALRTFALNVSANIRTTDRFGRYGGEEFLLLLPETDRAMALTMLDRLRLTIGEVDWSAIADGLSVSMSAGLCEVRDDDVAETLLSRADAALYRAKNAGRNRVMAA
ncbi:MAG: diguanylate cyclase [Xanthobacteraceae bacterium]|nr:diguanylate cyclase [Xanthobacteraceae bacterium]